MARGLGDNEEILSTEEEVITKNRHLWTDKYRPRKPQYFNRAQLGFDWNKYNQTHYDQENPPPRVVQGYKFNIFYPDLADKTKAPTYRIERENGRRRGESLAPAGEDDTCLIRFMAGPPYEDVAFRIVDKEWDYSAKRERGFKSSFDKDILQLHFQFKKVSCTQHGRSSIVNCQQLTPATCCNDTADARPDILPQMIALPSRTQNFFPFDSVSGRGIIPQVQD